MSIRKRIWSAAMAPERLHIAGFKQFSFKTVLNVKNVSAERVWTSREFQTVGVASGYTKRPDANAMVAGGCCNSRADVERKVVHGW